MLYLAITFDYELFFGKNHADFGKVLIEPTDRICELLSEKGVSATFFADVCSAMRHSELGLVDYSQAFDNQLRMLDKNGHDVQLHIHPHWFCSRFENVGWVFPENGYRLHDFGDKAEQIIKSCVGYLNGIIKPVNPEYECIAYRAGGYCIQPYDKLVKALCANGMVVDSSVALMRENRDDESHYYDYTKVPECANFWLEPGRELKDSRADKVCGESLFEIPIGFYKQSFITRLKLGNEGMSYKHGAPLGVGVAKHNAVRKNRLMKLIGYGREYVPLSLDNMNARLLTVAVDRLYNLYEADKNDVCLAVIGHPKMFTGDAFKNLSEFADAILSMPDKYGFISVAGYERKMKART